MPRSKPLRPQLPGPTEGRAGRWPAFFAESGGRIKESLVRSIRQLDLKKSPSVSETLDWARTLVLLGIDSIDAEQAKETLHVLLKYQTDIAKAAKELSID